MLARQFLDNKVSQIYFNHQTLQLTSIFWPASSSASASFASAFLNWKNK
jgi:hypothetical protein